jgi:hypothetical protein
MRWTLVLALSVLVLAVPARAGRQEVSATMTIRLIVAAEDSRYLIDRAPKGYPNKGDVVRERSVLRNAVAQFGRAKGAIVGRDTWITTVVIPPFGRAEVKGRTILPGGTIGAIGTVTAAQTTGTFRVVGGTGTYANARGTISLRNLNASGSRGLSVYRLQLP